MPDVEYFEVMARYNRWMNDKLYAVCAAMPDAERRRDQGAFFKSIHGTLNHILLADILWLDRFYGRPLRIAVTSLDEQLYADFGELQQARQSVDTEILTWIETLDVATLSESFTFTSIVSPAPRTFLRWHALMHFFNHQTHHRGQLTTLISQVGYEPGVTDLMWLPGMEIAQ